MKTARRPALCLALIVTFVAAAAGQSETIDVRATGEYRSPRGESRETGTALALASARDAAFKETIAQLGSRTETKALSIKDSDLSAFVSAVVELSSEVSGNAEDANVHRVSVQARLNVLRITRRLDKLRKDPAAVSGATEAWQEIQKLNRDLAEIVANPGRRDENEKIRLLGHLRVADLALHVSTALAKTQESPASARVSLPNAGQRALHIAEMAVVLGPDSALARTALGEALAASSMPAEAEAEYRRALVLNPSSAAAHIKLAEVLRVQNRSGESVSELREALKIQPSSPAAHTDLGYILSTQQDNDGAIAEYQKAVKADPDYVEAHNYLAISFARQGKFEDAVAEFREMVRADRDSVLGYYNLGIALADFEKDDESAEAFRNVIRVNPNHFNSRYDLGELFRLEGKHDEAVKQFKEYLRLAPDTPQNQRNIRRAQEFIEVHDDPN